MPPILRRRADESLEEWVRRLWGNETWERYERGEIDAPWEDSATVVERVNAIANWMERHSPIVTKVAVWDNPEESDDPTFRGEPLSCECTTYCATSIESLMAAIIDGDNSEDCFQYITPTQDEINNTEYWPSAEFYIAVRLSGTSDKVMLDIDIGDLSNIRRVTYRKQHATSEGTAFDDYIVWDDRDTERHPLLTLEATCGKTYYFKIETVDGPPPIVESFVFTATVGEKVCPVECFWGHLPGDKHCTCKWYCSPFGFERLLATIQQGRDTHQLGNCVSEAGAFLPATPPDFVPHFMSFTPLYLALTVTGDDMLLKGRIYLDDASDDPTLAQATMSYYGADGEVELHELTDTNALLSIRCGSTIYVRVTPTDTTSVE
ncbi:MAG: hypothetical protein KDB07_09065, partial [Planctomycetes bacterium]|nr:hypothetical protein [Planctomycetota bacterium]